MAVYYMTSAVTPMTPEGKMDLDSCASLYEHLVRGGTDGILLLGDVGEFFGFTLEEKRDLIRRAVPLIRERARLELERVDSGTGDLIRTAGSPMKILVGTSSMLYQETVELSCFALEQGADAVLVVPPAGGQREHGGAYDYCASLAQDVQGKICLGNYPERTGWDILPSTVVELAEKYENVVGIRDTVREMGHTREIIRQVRPVREDFVVCSGFDDCFIQNALSGGNGCIGAITNLFPALAGEWLWALRDHNMETISRLQIRTDRLMDLNSGQWPLASLLKEALVLRGIIRWPTAVHPVPPVSREQKQWLAEILERYGEDGLR